MNAGGYIKESDYVWVIPTIDATTGAIIGYVPSQEGVAGARKVLSKLPCDNNLYFLYRPGGGNHVTSVMNNKTNNKIIGRFNTTSEYPNFNVDPGETSKRFNFLERQNKTVNRSFNRNRKVNF